MPNTNKRSFTVETEDGPYVVYHRDDAGCPEAHTSPHGPWYFQPESYSDGNVFSLGYATAYGAEEAAHGWAQRARAERDAAEMPERARGTER